VFRVEERPGASFVPAGTLSPRVHQISPRRAPLRADATPGPGAYDPRDGADNRAARVAVSSAHRDPWTPIGCELGPGVYEPAFDRARFAAPAFTIGRRSRARKRSEVSEEIGFGIDVLFIRITDPSLDREQVLVYLRKHRELQKMLTVALEEIFAEKPEKPVRALRSFFQSMPRTREYRRW
jgi:hypothetical protein